jgi:glutaredoxin
VHSYQKALDKAGIEYAIVDITENSAARDYVPAVGRGRSSSPPPAIGQVFASDRLSRLAA